MSAGSTEIREDFECYFESRELAQKIEQDLKDKMVKGQEFYSDLIPCPNVKCRNPLKVNFQEDGWELFCKNCGFAKKIYKNQNI